MPNYSSSLSWHQREEIEKRSVEETSDSDIPGDESGTEHERGIQCYSCQGYGHIADYCPEDAYYNCK